MPNTLRKAPQVLAAAILACLTLAMPAHPSARYIASTPVILQVMPAAPAPASSPQVLEVGGHDFQAGLSLMLSTPDGGSVELKDNAITGQSETTFHVSVVLDREGTYQLTVTNRDGGVSPPFVLHVKGGRQSAAAVIDDVTPKEPRKGPAPQDLHVTGRGFAAGMQVRLTDPAGKEVTGSTVSKITGTSFDLRAAFTLAGDYQLAVVSASGSPSNVWHMNVQ